MVFHTCHNTPIFARKQFFTRVHKSRNTKKNKEIRGYAIMIKIFLSAVAMFNGCLLLYKEIGVIAYV
jgi:hypothetical protein